MRDFRVSVVQSAPILGRVDANLESHLASIVQAKKEGAQVVVFPELSLTGYHLLDQVPEVALTVESPLLAELARASTEIDLLVGFVEEAPTYRYYNSAAYFSSGALQSVQRKLYLPTYGMFQEGRDFAAGDRLRAFDTSFARCGTLICEDLWHQSNAWLLSQEGAEVIFGLSNSPTRGAKPERGITSLAVWQELLQVSAQFQTTFMVYANRVGCEDGLNFGGGSMVLDPFGRVLERLPPLEEGQLTLTLEAEILRRARTAYPLLRDERLDLVYRELKRVRAERYDLPTDRSSDEDEPA